VSVGDFFRKGQGPQKPAPPRLDARQYTVLVIDDDPDFLHAMESMLRGMGFGVLTSGTGIRGLEMLNLGSRPVHAVLLDYKMPKFDGAQTLAHLRKRHPHVKVIGVTGVALEHVPRDFYRDVDEFVTKPVSSTRLLEALRMVLS
jgi:two-component system cell cycle sensor histidine kinase/response regulator CckA